MKNVKLLKKEHVCSGLDYVKFEVNGHLFKGKFNTNLCEFYMNDDWYATLFGFCTGFNYYLPPTVKQDVTKEEAFKWVRELCVFLSKAAYC